MELTQDHIQAAWDRFKEPWDFDRNGPLTLPVLLPFRPYSDEPTAKLPPRVIVRKEFGRYDGRPAVRYVGTIDGTTIKKVLGLVVDGNPINPAYADDQN